MSETSTLSVRWRAQSSVLTESTTQIQKHTSYRYEHAVLQVSACVESLSLLTIAFIFPAEAETVSKEKAFWGCEISEEASEISQAILGQVSISRDTH